MGTDIMSKSTSLRAKANIQHFKYSGYVSGLSQKINTYYKELTYIFNTLKKSEKKYERLFEEHIPKVTNLPESKYKSRIGIKDFM